MTKIIRKDQQNRSDEQLVAASTTLPTTPTNQSTALLSTLVSPLIIPKTNDKTITIITMMAPKTMKRQYTSSLVLSKR